MARFDGVEWRHILTGRHVPVMGIASDGLVWFVTPDEDIWDADGEHAGDDIGSDLYVITPETVTAGE